MILKIHGAVDRARPDRDSYVITEDHYIDYLTRTTSDSCSRPTLLAKLRGATSCSSATACGLEPARDPAPDLGAAAARYKSWAIQEDPTRSNEEFWRGAGSTSSTCRSRLRDGARARLRRRSSVVTASAVEPHGLPDTRTWA